MNNQAPKWKIVSGSEDTTVRVWDLVTNTHQTLKGHTRYILSVAISLDGQKIVSGSGDQTIKI